MVDRLEAEIQSLKAEFSEKEIGLNAAVEEQRRQVSEHAKDLEKAALQAKDFEWQLAQERV